MSETIYARVAQKRDTLTNWLSEDPMLYAGEIAIVEVSSTEIRFKVGDGAQNFSTLPYANDLTGLFTIRAATPTTNPGAPTGNAIWETSTAGTYTYFLDATATPINVAVGEYVRMIDNGSYFEKVVVPFSTAGLATIAGLTTIGDAVFDLVYKEKPTLPTGVNPVIEKGTPGTGGTIYATAPPSASDWYVDMTQSFDLARLKTIGFLQPAATGEYYAAIVTINQETNVMTILAQDSANCTMNIDTGIDFETVANNLTSAGVRTAPNIKCFAAIKNKTNNPIRIEAVAGCQIWRYDGTTGAYVSKITGTDAPIEVHLYDENTLQNQIRVDRGVTPIQKINEGGVITQYHIQETDGTLLIDTGSGAFPSDIYLPGFGVDAGKIVTVKVWQGNTLQVVMHAKDGALLEGSAGTILMNGVGVTKRFQYDGRDWWVV